jgi:hypothetical protein
MYTVNGIKSFRGMEGLGFNANLLRDGKKVAFVIDSAQGGCLDIQWVDYKEPRVSVSYLKSGLEEDKLVTRNVTPEEKLLLEYVSTLPKQAPDEFWKNGYRIDDETFIANLVDEAEFEKGMASAIKRNEKKGCVCFRLSTDKKGAYHTIEKGKLTKEQTIKFLKLKYDEKLSVVY